MFTLWSWFDRSRQGRHFSSQELSLIRRFLPADDRRCDLLFKQAEYAPYVMYTTTHDRYCATISFVHDTSLLVECGVECVSPTIEIRDGRSGRLLHFYISVQRGGFLTGLCGMAVDGNEWPRKWEIEESASTVECDIAPWLPFVLSPSERSESFLRLCKWSNAFDPESTLLCGNNIEVMKAANAADITDSELRMGGTIPAQYEDFVCISNGISIRRGRFEDIFGTQGILLLSGTRPAFVISCLSEEGALYMHVGERADNNVYFLAPHSFTPEPVGDLRSYVKELLERTEP